MLRFISSLFTNPEDKPGGLDEALIDKAIERAVAGTDRRLHALGDYRARLVILAVKTAVIAAAVLAGTLTGNNVYSATLMAGAVQGTLGALLIYLTVGKIEEPEAVRADREELQRAAAEGDEEAKQLLADDPLGEAPGEGLAQSRLPFGPFLILALLELLFFGQQIGRALQHLVGA